MVTALPALSHTQLRLFLLVADLGSYTAAALQACRSQSALSLAIRQMENKLGEGLFEPAARTVLTPFGQGCVPIARTLVDQHERSVAAMHNLAQSRTGKLTIACVGTALRVLVAPSLGRFVAKYPDIGISLLDYNSANVERAVLSYEADLGFCSRVSSNERLHFTPLFGDSFGVVCDRGHPFSQRKSMTWDDLNGATLIGSPVHALLDNRPEAAVLRTCKYQSTHMNTTIAMLEQGLGVSVLGSSTLLADKPGLCYVPLVKPVVKFELGLLKLNGRTLPPPAAAMERIMLAEHRMTKKAPHSGLRQ